MEDWTRLLKEFEDFLGNIPLKEYKELRKIKTVEQDLPKQLNPMHLLYQFYWEQHNFVSFDEFFNTYWNDNISHIEEFRRKYFWGCCMEFVKEGFRARIYRTWISFLTQLHFLYLWNSLLDEKVQANVELDMQGIDGLIEIPYLEKVYKVGLQVKKISMRREVRERKFRKRRRTQIHLLIEIPYSVSPPEELTRKIESPRVKEHTKEACRRELEFIQRYLRRLPNGFVIFREEYARAIYDIIHETLSQGELPEKLPKVLRWDEIIALLLRYQC